MEKWKEDIEKVLARNPTVDRWIIHDFVWRENHPWETLVPIMMKCMEALKALMLTGPGDVSDPEWLERITNSLIEAGWSREMVDDFIERLKANVHRLHGPGAGQATDEESREAFGDDD